MQWELDKKLPKSNWVPVQSEPLDRPATFTPPVGDLGTAAPPYKEPSNAATVLVVYPDEGYNYGAHYRGFQAIRYNSLQVNDDEADARAEYRYQQHHHPMPAPGYVDAYSTPYSDPNAQGQGFCVSHIEPQRERARHHSTGGRPHGAHHGAHGAPTSGRLFCLFAAALGVYRSG
jgi:hypothetical protein